MLQGRNNRDEPPENVIDPVQALKPKVKEVQANKFIEPNMDFEEQIEF